MICCQFHVPQPTPQALSLTQILFTISKCTHYPRKTAWPWPTSNTAHQLWWSTTNASIKRKFCLWCWRVPLWISSWDTRGCYNTLLPSTGKSVRWNRVPTVLDIVYDPSLNLLSNSLLRNKLSSSSKPLSPVSPPMRVPQLRIIRRFLSITGHSRMYSASTWQPKYHLINHGTARSTTCCLTCCLPPKVHCPSWNKSQWRSTLRRLLSKISSIHQFPLPLLVSSSLEKRTEACGLASITVHINDALHRAVRQIHTGKFESTFQLPHMHPHHRRQIQEGLHAHFTKRTTYGPGNSRNPLSTTLLSFQHPWRWSPTQVPNSSLVSGMPYNFLELPSAYHVDINRSPMARLRGRYRKSGDTCAHIAMITKTAGAIFYHGPSMHKTLYAKPPQASHPSSAYSATNRSFPWSGEPSNVPAIHHWFQFTSTYRGQFEDKRARPMLEEQWHPNTILGRRSGSQPWTSVFHCLTTRWPTRIRHQLGEVPRGKILGHFISSFKFQ